MVVGEVSFQSAGSGATKSPRKSISQAEQKATMKLGLLEQQMTEEKERHEEELDRLKDEISDLRKQVNRVECDNLKMDNHCCEKLFPAFQVSEPPQRRHA